MQRHYVNESTAGRGRLAVARDWAMTRRGRLATVAAGQLGAGGLGLAVAIRRRHAYDFLLFPFRGSPEHVVRDSVLMGTALSAPATMLVTQAVATFHVARGLLARGNLTRGDTGPADRVLGVLGAAMVAGYLGEALVRRRLRPSGFDPLETPLAATGIVLAATMAGLGLAPAHGR
jgi:hypothetical protein